MIANPSFEKPGMDYWSTNGSGTRTALDDTPLGSGFWQGEFTRGTAPVIVESNIFPTNREEFWTIQFLAKGNGNIKVGFVWWDDDFEEVAVDWGPVTEQWELNEESFVHVAVHRTPVQTYQGMLRIECTGTALTLDDVLVERGFLKDWPYFDGDTKYGARDDFSWYGGQIGKCLVLALV